MHSGTVDKVDKNTETAYYTLRPYAIPMKIPEARFISD
jgi:hypothetical protein